MNRAYSLLDIKNIDDDQRVITGIASTPSPDRMDDIVLPEGAVFKLPLPLLWQHNHSEPIGHVTKAKITTAGIEIVAHVAKNVSEEIDRAWRLIKAGLVQGLSIGFRGLETEAIPGSFGVKFTKWEWLELSSVTIPANAEATLTSVKAMDRAARKATARIERVHVVKLRNDRVVKLDKQPPRINPHVVRGVKTGRVVRLGDKG
ncbi:hypothetical protein ATN84_01760 [Paramesorhizobium deserti]|uniref:Prohead serine protease domain-containing protein n=1 Tax=Paramesorhizobium deserti TaxID=1494590 RepID=A0A135HZA1_9HYPH|nr:HK97 family phage prohead protease [Paramesorhizobium deserti]KXF78544.1 hypothetical protein ATN84_01760 [Paramesorhizobium deserti]